METDLALLSEETATLRIFADEESVRLLRFAGYEGEFAIPTRFLPALQPLVDDLIPDLLQSLNELPNPSLIRRVLMTPFTEKGQPSACQLLQNSATLHIKLPYAGVSMAADLRECFAEILVESFPIKRYLFGLACDLQQTLAEESPTFSNNSSLFQFLVSSLCQAELSDTELSKRPLLSLLALETIAETIKSCKTELSESAKAQNAIILSKCDYLRQRTLAGISDRLLHIANENNDQALRALAAKLLLYLGSLEQVERISGVCELDFQGEPVGEKILQRLKYVASLESLNLGDTFFPSEALRHLSFLPILRVLRLQGTRTHNNAIVYLSSSPSLEDIDCSYTEITDDGARQFLSFKRLKTVHLAATGTTNQMIDLLKEAGLNVISE